MHKLASPLIGLILACGLAFPAPLRAAQHPPPLPPEGLRVFTGTPPPPLPELELRLPPWTGQWVSIKKLLTPDCRVVRGFAGSPVDGMTNSWDYGGALSEYPRRNSLSLFDYNRNDGLHIRMLDTNGFNLIVLHGGAVATLYHDYNYPGILSEPSGSSQIWTFTNKGASVQTLKLPSLISGSQFAFHGVTRGAGATNSSGNLDNGCIADVAFYRLTETTSLSTLCTTQRVGSIISLAPPVRSWDPMNLYRALTNQYPLNNSRVFSLSITNPIGTPLQLPSNYIAHFVTQPSVTETGLVAVTLEADVTSAKFPLHGSIAVQDPLDPMTKITWLHFTIEREGKIPLRLDIPDQVLLGGSQVWLSMSFDQDIILASANGGAPEFIIEFENRAAALPEALTWRKFLMKHFYGVLSEPREWNLWSSSQTNVSMFLDSLATGKAARIAEFFQAIDSANALMPTDKLVKQYRDWTHKRDPAYTYSSANTPSAPPPGVPAWAWYPRMAWLEQRRIVEWCLSNRCAPNGELGGTVQDDSDFYQQTSDLPSYETNSVASRLKSNAAALYETAKNGFPWRAPYLIGGINRSSKDSLHAYEEGINHLALVTRWNYGNPIYLEDCMESALNIQRLIVRTNQGSWFRNNSKVGLSETNAPVTRDGYATPLLWHTTLQLADYNRNPTALSNITAWADTWMPFILASNANEIDIKTEAMVDIRPLQPLTGYGQAPVFSWLANLIKTPKYIEPWIDDYTAMRRTYPTTYYVDTAYSAGLIDSIPETFSFWSSWNCSMQLSTTSNYTRLVNELLAPATAYGAHVVSLIDAMRFPDMQTTEEPYSDRIGADLLEWPSRAFLGGYTRRNEFSPKAAISWEGFGTNFGGLVIKHRRDKLVFCIYNFDDVPLRGAVRLWELEHGTYRISLGQDANQDFTIDSLISQYTNHLAKADGIDVVASPKSVTIIDVQQIARLEPIFDRPDLAIARAEIGFNSNSITGIVHNIGSATVTNIIITLYEVDHTAITNVTLGSLTAPTDLQPRRRAFSIPFEGNIRPFWIKVDSDARIPEIYEGNNEVFYDGSQ